jgi:hypothetical protein
VRRGDFLNDDPAYALPLLKAIETDAIRAMTTISGVALADAAGAAEKARKQIEADIANGAIEGYGLVVLTASPGSAVCAVVPDRRGGHLAVLAAMKGRLDAALGVDLAPPVLEPSAEAAFADIQRKACIGVYASAADLKDLLPALRREQIAYRLDENWVTSAQVDGMQAAADMRDAADEQAAAERRQRMEEKRAVDAQRAADEAATKAARQAALRRQFGSLATAQATALAGSVRAFTESPGGDDDLAALFPAFTDWYRHQVADHWELLTLGGETADYGQGEWKGRRLEAVFARVSLRLRNMRLGRYEDACFDFGELIDAEFDGMRRDPVVSACEDPQTVAAWKTGHRFVSRWLAE